MTTTNTAELTHSHAVYTAKKKARKAQISQVTFDEDARREYLTGFRKRNLQKKEARVKSAKERARLHRLELRKEHRRELAERIAQNVKEVEGALGAVPEASGSAFSGSSSTREEGGGEEEVEYEDEEQLAVVTVVEGFSMADSPERESPPPDPDSTRTSDGASKQHLQPPGKAKPKIEKKAKKVRFETKAGRKAERRKQRARHAEKRERGKKTQKTMR